MDIFKSFATNADKEVTGSWVDLLPVKPSDKPMPRIKVARLGNRLHSRVMTKAYRENQAALNSADDNLQTLTDERLNIEVSAKTILLGWEGLEYAGEPIEYSYENAVKLLSHIDFRQLVLSHARNFENFRAEQEQAAKKD